VPTRLMRLLKAKVTMVVVAIASIARIAAAAASVGADGPHRIPASTTTSGPSAGDPAGSRDPAPPTPVVSDPVGPDVDDTDAQHDDDDGWGRKGGDD